MDDTRTVLSRPDPRSVLRMIALSVAVIVAVLVVLFALQRRLVYFPFPAAAPDPPAVAGLRELEIATEDGLRLRAWLVPAQADAADPTVSFTVLFFPGNAGNRAMRLPLALALARAGHRVVLVDYRGYGGNPGRPTERGLVEDARAVRRHLLEHEGVTPDRLVYFGESLGTGVAVALAAEHPPAALILRSPFPSLVAVARTHYPLLPVGLMLLDRFDSGSRISEIRCPLLVIAGARDRIVPERLSRKLFEAANEPKELLVIPEADHNDAALLAGDRLVAAVIALLERSVR